MASMKNESDAHIDEHEAFDRWLHRKVAVQQIDDPVFCMAGDPEYPVYCDRKKGHQGKHSWELGATGAAVDPIVANQHEPTTRD